MKILEYLIICSLFLTFSCIKDMGNYDYIELTDFRLDTADWVGSYNVQQGRELLVIDRPLIASDTTDYEYLWRLYQTTAIASFTPYDTLSTQRRLSTLINVAPGTTNILELRITQKSTGLFKYYIFGVGTIAAIPDGWMVVYEKDGMTDVDIVRGTNVLGYPTSVLQDTVIRNVLYGGLGGSMLEGTPVSVAANANGVFLATTTSGINHFQNNSFARLQDHTDLFLGSVPAVSDEQYIYNQGASFMMYVNNGTSYWTQNSTTPPFIGPSVLTANNVAVEYDAAPFVIYMLTKQGVLFDRINRRFFYQDQNSSALQRFPASSSDKFDLDNMGKDLIWMGPKVGTITHNPKTTYFKDIDGSKRWLYIVRFNDAVSTNDATRAASRVANIDITDLPDIADAKFYETSTLATNTFYATSSKLYSFFYNDATNSYFSLTNPFTAPAGEEITAIRLLFTTNSSTAMRRMAIATWNETTKVGKMYMYKIPVPTAGDFDPDPVVTTHEGKILVMETKTN